MRQRSLGSTTVTAVGAGEVSPTIAEGRGVGHGDVERALHHALELGITLVEAAAEPDAERLCGDSVRALRLRDRVTVATRVPALPGREVVQRMPARYVQEKIEATLRATKLDAVPLALLAMRPTWQSASAWPELVGMCERLAREGKVLQWGVWLDDDGVAEWREAAARPPEPAVKPTGLLDLLDAGGGFAPTVMLDALVASAALSPGGLFVPQPAPAATEAAPVKRGVFGAPFVAISARHAACDPALPDELPVLARAPLAGGALAGALGPGMKLTVRDDRRALDAAALDRIAVGCAELAAFVRRVPPAASASVAARSVLEQNPRRDDIEVTTLAELALRYELDRGAIAMPRLHRREHVAEAIAAAAAPPLSEALRERLDERFARLAR